MAEDPRGDAQGGEADAVGGDGQRGGLCQPNENGGTGNGQDPEGDDAPQGPWGRCFSWRFHRRLHKAQPRTVDENARLGNRAELEVWEGLRRVPVSGGDWWASHVGPVDGRLKCVVIENAQIELA